AEQPTPKKDVKEDGSDQWLQQVAAKTESAALKSMVSAELAKLQAMGTSEVIVPGMEAEAVRRSTAKILAQAEKAKRAATEALARAEGISSASSATDSAAGGITQPKFNVTWNEELFKGPEHLECEEAEGTALRRVHSQLQELQSTLSAKEADIQVMLDKAAAARKEVDDRGSGGVGAGVGSGATPDAAPTAMEAEPTSAAEAAVLAEAEQEEKQRLDQVAARLSAAKFAARRAELDEQK
ncbi:unnamed protein product, partial [Prorocentrum cordatum]